MRSSLLKTLHPFAPLYLHPFGGDFFGVIDIPGEKY